MSTGLGSGLVESQQPPHPQQPQPQPQPQPQRRYQAHAPPGSPTQALCRSPGDVRWAAQQEMEASFAAEAAAEAELVAAAEESGVALSPPLEKPHISRQPSEPSMSRLRRTLSMSKFSPSALPPIDSETVEDNTTEDDWREVADFDSKDDGSGAK